MPIKHSEIMSSASERIQRTEAYAEKVRKMFAATVNEILALNKTMPKLEEGVMFSFDDETAKMQKEVERLLRQLHSATTMAIKQGITLEWQQANEECDKLVSSAFGKDFLSSPMFTAWTERNESAMKAFMNRSDKGLKLSDRVWQSVHQLRDEMEVAMTIGIGEGQSAASMSRKVRQYLNDPDLMFRRFRYKDESGEWKLKWKKRIKDEKTGKNKWIDYDKKSYQDEWTGKGYYKSSAQNAMRVTRTETNMAYRRADHERWAQMDFVLGQRVQLSHNHPKKDICDKLQGDYPKEFVFDGWHPQCFCFVTPILVDESEMKKSADAFLKEKKYTPKGKQITEYPEAFKEWVKDHAEDIAKARDRGTEPYFIRNNAEVIDNILNPKKTLTILEKAKIRHDARTAEQRQAIIDRWEVRKKDPMQIAANRHAARTPEQIKAIKEQWTARQKKHALIRKTASNVLKVAFDYGEVDFSKLQQYISEGNLSAMQAETKIVAQTISATKKQENALSSLIPDAHSWHKQFSMEELQGVYSAVESKLKQWASLTLEQQAKKLKFEAYDFLGGNMHDVQSKYKTWKVSQAAYIKKYNSVLYEIDYQAAGQLLDVVKKWSAAHPKSAKVANLVSEAEVTYGKKGDLAGINTKIAAAQAEMNKRIAEQARRDAKKNVGTIFGADAYTKARKDAAMWAKNTKDADKRLRDKCGDIWRNAPKEEKNAIYGYTESYHNINEPLRGLNYIGSPAKTQEGLKRIPQITKIIDKSNYDFDMWVQRGDDMVALKKFGLSNYNLATDTEVYALVGKTGTEGAFWSAGVSKGKGFPGDIIFNIYMPKGTKAMYCEPFSAFGHGGGKSWNGISGQSSFGYESEILLQRGTTFRITKVEKSGGQWYIDLEVIAQDVLPFPYTGGYPYK